jgi:xanthine/CO dehydrogenase XdhC/CoxF family maturation factor
MVRNRRVTTLLRRSRVQGREKGQLRAPAAHGDTALGRDRPASVAISVTGNMEGL